MGAKDELVLVRDTPLLGRRGAHQRDFPRSDGLLAFVALAWSTTWILSLPLVWSSAQGLPPRPFMLAFAGLSAFGPTFAAFVVAKRRKQLREVFCRFRTNPLLLAAALAVPLCLHLVARVTEHALGGEVVRWFWLPQTSAQVVALVLFSLGEEFGWRGFAHPRLLERYGAVFGPLLTGLIWGFWHLLYVIGPNGTIDLSGFTIMLLQFTLWGPVVAWCFERAQRSMSVAIAIHAGGHLDNAAQIPPGQWRMKMLTLLVLAIAALFAARSLKGAAARQSAP